MNYRSKALTAFCKLRRLQEANGAGYVRCITCGKLVKWNECDGGHLIHRAIRGTEVEPDNVWPQCIACNRFGNISEMEYASALAQKIGWDRIGSLMDKRDLYERKDYESLYRGYQSEIRSIRKEKGL
jgi:hypothetical protein